ncbi:MAG: cyclic pyranopterin monophosphate synthase MoaC [Deltaproteobacteria bacterium]|nr:cyclic pyranopterin monophosphate synthase MoaC [Deltaproteobacteria bacterium]
MSETKLTHFDESGRAKMVDVSNKSITTREAVATGAIFMKPETLALIESGNIKKGDVLAVAQVAGIMGAKKTSHIIPMCHPLMLTGVSIAFDISESPDKRGLRKIDISATVKTKGQTGVEMEALTAVSTAALTIYDMCKAADKDMIIGETALLSKRGGKSGTYIRGGNK